jgi:hypothetical protein
MNDAIIPGLAQAKPQATAGSSDEVVYDHPVKLHVTCLHLRHKLMYVDQRHMQRGMVDDSSDTRVFWCNKTQSCLGPDGESVSRSDCSQGRGCYCHGA